MTVSTLAFRAATSTRSALASAVADFDEASGQICTNPKVGGERTNVPSSAPTAIAAASNAERHGRRGATARLLASSLAIVFEISASISTARGIGTTDFRRFFPKWRRGTGLLR